MATVARLNVLLSANAKDFEKKITTAERKLAKFGRNASKIGRTLTTRVTAPLALVGAAAIKMAADAQESENLFEVSMGNMAGAARQYSEQLRKELGLNAYEVRKNIGTFNQMFSAMGIGEDRAYGMATGLSKLSADMASFFNLRPEDAFQKLQSGISGEVEPLRRLGILVDEQTIRQAAMRAGFIKSGEAMSQQQKVYARYLAILEQTVNAQGDLARTMDSPINQMRRFKVRLEETAIEMGQKLIPAFKIALSLANTLASAVSALVSGFSLLPKWVQGTNIAMVALGLAIGPVIWVVGSLARSVGELTKAFRALAGVAAIRGLIALLANPWVAAFVAATVAVGGLTIGIRKLTTDAANANKELRDLAEIDIDLAKKLTGPLPTNVESLKGLRNQITKELGEALQARDRMTAQGVPLGGLFDADTDVLALQKALVAVNLEIRNVETSANAAAVAMERVTRPVEGVRDFDAGPRMPIFPEWDDTLLKQAVLRAPLSIEKWVSEWPAINIPLFFKYEKPEFGPVIDDTSAISKLATNTSIGINAGVNKGVKQSARFAESVSQTIGGAIINGIVYGIKDGADFLKAILASILSAALSALTGGLFGAGGALSSLFSVQTKVDFAPILTPKFDDVVLSVVPELQPLFVPAFDPLMVDVVPQFQMGRFAPEMGPNVLELDTTASYNMTNSPIVDVEPPRIEVVVNTYPSLFANPSEAARDPQAQVFIRDAMSRAKYQGYR